MTVRMRHTRAHTKNRRSHHALSEPAVSNDQKDGLHLRHRVSPITGKYKGEQIIKVENKISKKTSSKELKEKTEEKPKKKIKEEAKKETEENKK